MPSNNRPYEPGLEVVEAERNPWGAAPEVAQPGTWDKRWNDVTATPLSIPDTPAPQYSALGVGNTVSAGYGSTPPPPGSYEGRPFGGGYQYPGMQQLEEQKGPSRGEQICGLRKKVFYIVIGVGILIAVAAIAIGVGAGIAFGHSSGDAPASNTTQPVNTTLPSTTDGPITCPGANLANYTTTAGGTKQYYRVLCGVDYHSDDGAVELTSVRVSTMNDCIDSCAVTDGCIAAGWGNSRGVDTCFMKQQIGGSHSAPHWTFATKLDGPP